MPQAERAKTRTSSTLSYKSFSSDKNFRSDSLRVDAGLRDQSFMSRTSDVRRERKLQERKQRPLHHGGTEARRKAKNKWALSEPLIPGCIQNQGRGYFSFVSPAEK